MKSLLLITLFLISFYSYAQTKCVPDGRGGICCWDVGQQGPFRPIGC